MKAPIYTRTGDDGTTSLVDGTRLPKNSCRIEAYGTVDELNSFIGVLIASSPLTGSDIALLTEVQNRLFDIGSCLAAGNEEMTIRLTPDLAAPLANLENAIDELYAALPPAKSFILPQGSQSAAAAHAARAVARRAERRILDLNDALRGRDNAPSANCDVNPCACCDDAASARPATAAAAAVAQEESPCCPGVDPQILKYINRLSDYLFVLSRHCNQIAGIGDICWTPTVSK